MSVCLFVSQFQPLNYFSAFQEVWYELYDIEGNHNIYIYIYIYIKISLLLLYKYD
jgi:hypothetical protein